MVIKIGIASEVVYEVESVKTQSIPPIPQLLGVKKKNGHSKLGTIRKIKDG